LVFNPTSVASPFGVGLSAYLWLSLDSNHRIDKAGKRILPVELYLKDAKTHWKAKRFWQFPTLFWLNAGDNFLQAICLLIAGASLMYMANFFAGWVLLLMRRFYLSIYHCSSTFFKFSWIRKLLHPDTPTIQLFTSRGGN
jgi:hypothetical protein